MVRGSVGPERIINGGVIVSGISNYILAASNDRWWDLHCSFVSCNSSYLTRETPCPCQ